LLHLLARLIDFYSLIVLVSVILSWVRLSEDNPLVKISNTLVEPVLAPIRRVLPSFGGLDLSPMVLLFALRMARRFLLGY
jgi:YggT family protein